MHFILLATNLEAKMNSLSEIYFTTERYLFPMVEEEIGEISEKMKEFLRIVEIIRPARFLTDALRWCGLGRPMKDWKHILRAFFMKSVYDFPTTKVLIENLKDNYGARHVRVQGHWKVWCHLMFGVIAITVKQLFNMIV